MVVIELYKSHLLIWLQNYDKRKRKWRPSTFCFYILALGKVDNFQMISVGHLFVCKTTESFYYNFKSFNVSLFLMIRNFVFILILTTYKTKVPSVSHFHFPCIAPRFKEPIRIRYRKLAALFIMRDTLFTLWKCKKK